MHATEIRELLNPQKTHASGNHYTHTISLCRSGINYLLSERVREFLLLTKIWNGSHVHKIKYFAIYWVNSSSVSILCQVHFFEDFIQISSWIKYGTFLFCNYLNPTAEKNQYIYGHPMRYHHFFYKCLIKLTQKIGANTVYNVSQYFICLQPVQVQKYYFYILQMSPGRHINFQEIYFTQNMYNVTCITFHVCS